MSVPVPHGGRRRWPIAALSVALAAITIVTVTVVTRRHDDAPVLAPQPVEPAAPPSAPPVPEQPTPASPPAVSPPQASPPPGSSAAAPSASEERVAPPQVAPAAPDRDRREPDAPSESGAPRTVPPPTAGTAPGPTPRSQAGADTIDVAIDSTPPGAQVVLDDAAVGTTPYHGTLPRGNREARLVLRLTGYVDKVIVARASQPITERVTLVRKAPAQPPPAKGPKITRDRSVNPF